MLSVVVVVASSGVVLVCVVRFYEVRVACRSTHTGKLLLLQLSC